jgi:hypothetical protein
MENKQTERIVDVSKKMTAVEWLEEKMIVSGFLIPKSFVEQAKQLEKEQIMDAYNKGFSNPINAEQFYNETYN